jgi:hypothetical protein
MRPYHPFPEVDPVDDAAIETEGVKIDAARTRGQDQGIGAVPDIFFEKIHTLFAAQAGVRLDRDPLLFRHSA